MQQSMEQAVTFSSFLFFFKLHSKSLAPISHWHGFSHVTCFAWSMRMLPIVVNSEFRMQETLEVSMCPPVLL